MCLVAVLHTEPHRLIESFQFAMLRFSWTQIVGKLFFGFFFFFLNHDEAQLHSMFCILFAEG